MSVLPSKAVYIYMSGLGFAYIKGTESRVLFIQSQYSAEKLHFFLA